MTTAKTVKVGELTMLFRQAQLLLEHEILRPLAAKARQRSLQQKLAKRLK